MIMLTINFLYRLKFAFISVKGLEIPSFPCNQFGEEEPGSSDQIEVNGDNASPLYKYLKLGKWGIFGDDIQWNFAKFLVSRDGQVVHPYYPTTSSLSLEFEIKKLLWLSQNSKHQIFVLIRDSMYSRFVKFVLQNTMLENFRLTRPKTQCMFVSYV
ncbi:probable glutathione peroxidase 8 [Durio zibethinus]|uniref:Probable glutathione peroxidase 8 n=1 Tax=Durio zibethinus TaxID=66656 RepID=A0A6P5WX98_DURZI|nr:probable glutathione peroxidase 8 [Durio zibethinus]